MQLSRIAQLLLIVSVVSSSLPAAEAATKAKQGAKYGALGGAAAGGVIAGLGVALSDVKCTGTSDRSDCNSFPDVTAIIIPFAVVLGAGAGALVGAGIGALIGSTMKDEPVVVTPFFNFSPERPIAGLGATGQF